MDIESIMKKIDPFNLTEEDKEVLKKIGIHDFDPYKITKSLLEKWNKTIS